jgi:arsenate reductase
MKKEQVLILCTANSARSQMGEGLMRHMAGDSIDVYSAGTRATQVNPFAIEAMQEIGIDISGHTSKSQDQFLTKEFDFVITVCDNVNKNCPRFPGSGVHLHWGFPDPASTKGDHDEILASFRTVRDALQERIRTWLDEEKDTTDYSALNLKLSL